MERGRRRRLAEELAARIVRARKDVVAVVLFGSVARGDDRPDSDVELMTVTRRGGHRPEYVVLDGILFCLYFGGTSYVRRGMLEPRGDATSHGFLEGVALYDPRHWFEKLRREVAALPASFYEKGASKSLHSMYEYVCKARNAHRSGDRENLVYATGVVGYEARVLVALINHRHYRSENTMTTEWRDFPDLPPGFGRHVSVLLGDRATAARRYRTAMALWHDTRAWAARRGVRLNRVRSLRGVRIPKTR